MKEEASFGSMSGQPNALRVIVFRSCPVILGSASGWQQPPTPHMYVRKHTQTCAHTHTLTHVPALYLEAWLQLRWVRSGTPWGGVGVLMGFRKELPEFRVFLLCCETLWGCGITAPQTPVLAEVRRVVAPRWPQEQVCGEANRPGHSAFEKIICYSQFLRGGGTPCHAGLHRGAPGLVSKQKRWKHGQEPLL